MSEFLCPHEHAVILANQSGQWSEDLRRHVAGCTDCAEALRIAGWLGQFAERLGQDGRPPHPTLVWLKAQLEEEQRNDARAIRQAALRQAFVQCGVALVALLGGAWLWPTVKTAFTEARGLVTVVFPVGAEGTIPGLTLILVLLALGLACGFLFRRFRGTFSGFGDAG